jgi:hypothetical protein
MNGAVIGTANTAVTPKLTPQVPQQAPSAFFAAAVGAATAGAAVCLTATTSRPTVASALWASALPAVQNRSRLSFAGKRREGRPEQEAKRTNYTTFGGRNFLICLWLNFQEK